MVCIYCGGQTRVTNSREQKRANQIWRRRQCQDCQAVFSTEERAVTDNSLLVAYSAKHVEPFSREKLLLSVYEALRHRKTAIQDATALCDTIWTRLQSHIDSAQVSRDDLVDVAYSVIKRFDHAGGVAYLAFHRR